MPIAFHDLPADYFPLLIEALHPATRAVVWSRTVEKPPQPGGRELVYIPPLAQQLGHLVVIRVRLANGEVLER